MDTVNNPTHYIKNGIELIDVIESWGLIHNSHLANAVKYIVRSGFKGNEKEDLKKAKFYLNRFLKWMDNHYFYKNFYFPHKPQLVSACFELSQSKAKAIHAVYRCLETNLNVVARENIKIAIKEVEHALQQT